MFQRDISLKEYSNYKIGGPAAYFYVVRNVEELKEAILEWRKLNLGKPIFILGGGTNLLINDEGFDGLVIKPEFKKIEREGNLVRVGSGVLVSEFLNYLITEELSGLEWAGGLPGMVGGAIRGNAGAFGGETKDNIKEVVSLDISLPEPKLVVRKNSECQFGYRNSIYKIENGREIILEAVFEFRPYNREEIQKATQEKIDYRNTRHPMDLPSIGSIFKNTDLKSLPESRWKEFEGKIKTDPMPVIPTAYLVSECDLKGTTRGGAMISPKHPNFIVNFRNATAADVEALIQLVKESVKKKFDINLEEEIIRV